MTINKGHCMNEKLRETNKVVTSCLESKRKEGKRGEFRIIVYVKNKYACGIANSFESLIVVIVV